MTTLVLATTTTTVTPPPPPPADRLYSITRAAGAAPAAGRTLRIIHGTAIIVVCGRRVAVDADSSGVRHLAQHDGGCVVLVRAAGTRNHDPVE